MKSKNVFENLRMEMARRQSSISDLACELGINRVTLSKKLSTQSYNITLAEAIRISKFLEQPVEYLFEELFETE